MLAPGPSNDRGTAAGTEVHDHPLAAAGQGIELPDVDFGDAATGDDLHGRMLEGTSSDRGRGASGRGSTMCVSQIRAYAPTGLDGVGPLDDTPGPDAPLNQLRAYAPTGLDDRMVSLSAAHGSATPRARLMPDGRRSPMRREKRGPSGSTRREAPPRVTAPPGPGRVRLARGS